MLGAKISFCYGIEVNENAGLFRSTGFHLTTKIQKKGPLFSEPFYVGTTRFELVPPLAGHPIQMRYLILYCSFSLSHR